ncbi:hypothetical protein ACFRAE_08575 [Sphingobacterium sp. HJSM2_6]|uniref:hypothetical protein n=1 Tax=Sphingobacterium sp. HJSM2_6 TaxID=3366264 RepID=UPI003BCCEBEE
MENILTIDLLQKYINEDKINKDLISYDSNSYIHFLKYFDDIDIINEHHFYIATGFIYSWMPTILKTVLCNEGVLDILNKIKAGYDVNEGDLTALTLSVNNSLVGVSKLLHFIAPSQYAIWDSRVCKSSAKSGHDILKT